MKGASLLAIRDFCGGDFWPVVRQARGGVCVVEVVKFRGLGEGVLAGGFRRFDGEEPGVIFVSLTRLRIRSWRFLPGFAVYAVRTTGQVKNADGFLDGALLADRGWTFWTMTAWESQERMRAYMTSGAHKAAMPKLLHWCDEASVAHWEQEESGLVAWEEADQRMRAIGRVSKVLHPSADHAGLRYREPRTATGGAIRRG